jgi:chromosome partitioning protein
MPTICIANHKGGVGKTTFSVNLSWELSRKKRTLLVDCDPQGNATKHLGFSKRSSLATLANLLEGDCAQNPVLEWDSRLAVLPSHSRLYEVATPDPFTMQTILSQFTKEYEYIIIDCAPSMSNLTLNAFCASDFLIAPIESGFLSLEGLDDLLRTLDYIQKNYHPAINLLAIVFNMVDRRQKLSREIHEHLQQHFGKKLARTLIPRNVKVAEAPSHAQPIGVYDPKCPAAAAFHDLTKELVKRIVRMQVNTLKKEKISF